MQEQIDNLKKDIEELKVLSVRKDIHPEIKKILLEVIVKSQENLAIINTSINTIIATLPTQTYGTGVPSGVQPNGSIYMRNTVSLATNEIYLYNGGWVQIK